MIMDELKDILDQQESDLRRATSSLNESVGILATTLSNLEDFPHILRNQLANSAIDIVKFIETIFIPVHKQSVISWRYSELIPFSKISEPPKTSPVDNPVGFLKEIINPVLDSIKISAELTRDPCIRLEVCYKALFFFIRAYQDTIYKVMLVIEGQKHGDYSSMADAVDVKSVRYKERNIVAENLSKYFPDYPKWFVFWRSKRNKVKEGADFSFSGPVEELGITFNTVESKGGIICDCSDSIKVSDILNAVNMCSKLSSICLKILADRKLP